MSVVEAVEHDLALMPDELRDSALAATALAMARRLDGGGGSPSECGKVLIQAMGELRELAPPKVERTAVDDLVARRRARLERSAGAAS